MRLSSSILVLFTVWPRYCHTWSALQLTFAFAVSAPSRVYSPFLTVRSTCVNDLILRVNGRTATLRSFVHLRGARAHTADMIIYQVLFEGAPCFADVLKPGVKPHLHSDDTIELSEPTEILGRPRLRLISD